ncbi:hypothetical protein BV25DRAFT_1918166 [Artomyces pyxidatus]|uniref:Uncharacterized protein n=1 Tax=Artomyces pyxidatus TaxID=48021 RepID=A0ACB8SUB6_9AGAM|nr:hypothetical protein BV25DRAFT_1918166 [Artomyces pyxidatus]
MSQKIERSLNPTSVITRSTVSGHTALEHETLQNGAGLAPATTPSLSVATLLPELLSRIFELVALAEKHMSWIPSTTYVCRHWRRVAFDHTSLWGHNIAFDVGQRWSEEMVARAKGAPISIVWAPTIPIPPLWGGQDIPSAVDKVAPVHLSHTKELRLPGSDEKMTRILQMLVPVPAPILELLFLEVIDAAALGRSDGALWSLPPTFLEKKTSKLRRFLLSGIFCPWTSLHSSALTKLYVVFPIPPHPSIGTISPSALNDFIDFLERTPLSKRLF